MTDLQIIQIPIASPQPGIESKVNSYLVGSQNESILIDAGFDEWDTANTIQKAISKQHFPRPTRILLTHSHPDHAPGARRLKHWHPILYFHSLEKPAMTEVFSLNENMDTFEVVELENGSQLTVDGHTVEVLHTPGHTAGHLCFYLPEKKILFSGDNVLGEGTTWIGPPEGNMTDYLRSLEFLDSLDIERIAPGHGHWVERPHERIGFIIQHRLEREKQILTLMQKKGNRADIHTLTREIYRDTIPSVVVPFAEKTVMAHLMKLEEEGVVRQLQGTGEAYEIVE